MKKWTMPKGMENWKRGFVTTLEVREKRSKRDTKNTDDVLHMAKGLAVAFAVTCIFFVAYGMCLTYTDIGMDSLPVVSLVCTAISSAIAGFDWAKCKEKRGFFWGLGAGVCYAVLLFLLTSLGADDFAWSLSKWMTLAVAICGGGVGGGVAKFVG